MALQQEQNYYKCYENLKKRVVKINWREKRNSTWRTNEMRVAVSVKAE